MKFSLKATLAAVFLSGISVALAQSVTLSAQSDSAVQRDYSALACGLGTSWTEHESVYPGIWTRRGNSNVFDANYPTARVTAVNTITVIGNKVYINRTGGNSRDCNYEGTIDPDGKTISGGYTCSGVGSDTWAAKVNCGSAPLSASSSPQSPRRDNSALGVTKNAAAIEKVAADSSLATQKAADKTGHDAAKATEKGAKKADTAVKKDAHTGDKGHKPDAVKPQQP